MLDTHWYEAASESTEDLAAQERQLQFTVSIYAQYFEFNRTVQISLDGLQTRFTTRMEIIRK